MKKFLVIGPPGTGKTSYIQGLVQRLCNQGRAQELLLLSMTTNAAHELRRTPANGEPLPLERWQVGTLHSHCYQALGQPDIAEKHIDEWNATHEDFKLSGAIKKKSLDEPEEGGGHDEDDAARGDADEIMRDYQLARAKLTPRDEWSERVIYFAEAWEAWKTERQYRDFTDLIDDCYAYVPDPPHNARILIVDEAQDCPPNQLRLIEQWGKNCDFFVLAGDDDQTLYSHVGASPLILMDPDVPPENVKILSQSYRVPQSIQWVAQEWVESLQVRVNKDYLPRDDMGIVRTLRGRYRDPRRVIDDVEERISEGKSVMLLASCSYMISPVITELRKRGLPFHNPLRKKRGDWNPLHAGNGTSMRQRVLSFLRPQNDVWGERWARMWNAVDLYEWLEILPSARSKKDTNGVLVHGAKARVEAWKEHAESSKDFSEIPITTLLDLFTDEAHLSAALDGDLDWLEEHVKPVNAKALTYPLHVARMRGGATLLETPKIIVGTIHSVKGGQSDCVYLFPDVSFEAFKHWQRGGDEKDALIRTMYVGITRAKEELVVCQQSSDFYLSLPLWAAAGREEEVAA